MFSYKLYKKSATVWQFLFVWPTTPEHTSANNGLGVIMFNPSPSRRAARASPFSLTPT